MKLLFSLYGLALARATYTYSNSEQDSLSLVYEEDAILDIRDLDNNLTKSLLPRTSDGKAPKPPPSSASRKILSAEQGPRSPKRTKQGFQSQPISAVGHLEPTSRLRAGAGSVNSSPIRERPSTPAEREVLSPGKRLGHILANERPTYRRRSGPIQRGDSQVLPVGVVQQHTGAARSIPSINRNDETPAAVQRFIREWASPPNREGRSPQTLTPQSSPDTSARLQVARQQLREESDRLWRIPGPPQPYRSPERRLENVGRAQNVRAVLRQPVPANPDHPVDQMVGMAARIAAGQPRDLARHWQEREAQGAAGGQGVGHGAVIPHQGQGPAQNQGIWPNFPASPSTSSTGSHFQ